MEKECKKVLDDVSGEKRNEREKNEEVIDGCLLITTLKKREFSLLKNILISDGNNW
jgi:hypothetical protein